MWTKKDIGSQAGKIVIVTGANSGIGFETALALYKAGAIVIIAARDLEKANTAIAKMKKRSSYGQLKAAMLDLSKKESVNNFVNEFNENYSTLNILINNAGVMVPPPSKTEAGYELQFGVNFAGHFLLTAYLYPLLKATPNSRVVTVTSLAYLSGQIDFENLKMEKGYDPAREYAQSKLANLLFTIELQRRIDESGDSVLSLASHPGVTNTNLSRHMSKEQYNAAIDMLGVLMPTAQGALSTLFAAVSSCVQKGSLYGPDGERGLSGYPAYTIINELANNAVLAKKLWDKAEEIIGKKFL
ncbi:oxidoreductase [Ferruginibacter paludis]|uniref:oxidoreductase n=1 Tax=Ferruginibacter paludis TaxID=1310417 RepID=UPI0025B54251|nr:oxidoreductase [Ferruginibacter paludis]MDN3656119.1 oxidoreductase [Ferruginibacter paludis]